MHASRSTLLLALLLVAVVILAACAPAATPVPATSVPAPTVAAPTTAPVPTTAPTTAPTAAPTTAPAPAPALIAGLKVSEHASLGKFIVDSAGRSLYMFTRDTKDTSNCYDNCEKAWPPLLAADKPSVEGGIDASLLGTTQRKDGKTQVTYNGMPLYYFASDMAAGDVKGQGVNNVWYVVAPNGDVIKGTASQAPSGAGSSFGLKISETAALGKFIVDQAGRTLYMFDKDTKDTSNCYDNCEKAWPPLTGTDKPSLPDGISASLLGTTQRKDGKTQITLNGFPLYYYTPDQNPGDVKGQGVNNVWWVLSPAGEPIKTGAAPTAVPSPKASVPDSGYNP